MEEDGRESRNQDEGGRGWHDLLNTSQDIAWAEFGLLAVAFGDVISPCYENAIALESLLGLDLRVLPNPTTTLVPGILPPLFST